ncbi:hypothetical protein BD309DRAFT_898428, partial [Dichomitus squalens]
LPWEVIEKVIDHSSEHTRALCNLALTCRQLHPRSSLVLFNHVQLERRQQLFVFCDVLQAQPNFRSIVRSLTIRLEEFSPFPLLSILPDLRSITFFGYKNFPRPRRFTSIHGSTLHCCRQFGRGLRSLTFRGVRFRHCTAFVRFITAFSGLQDLVCDDVQIWE